MSSPEPEDWRSDTEYSWLKGQDDAIRRTVAFYRRDFGYSVIWFSARTHAKAQPSLVPVFPRTSSKDLGSLDRLPLEILQQTILHLDMQYLLKFRQVSLRARATVDALKQYQNAVLRGLNALCALLRLNFAADVTLLAFHNVMCEKSCSNCGDFGGLVDMLSWRRCCVNCLDDEFHLIDYDYAAWEYKLTDPELKELKVLKPLPGTYSIEEGKYSIEEGKYSIEEEDEYTEILTLVSNRHALAIRNRRSPPYERQARKSAGTPRYHFIIPFMGSCEFPVYNEKDGTFEYGLSCAGCQLTAGRRVWTCFTQPEDNRLYSREGFMEHFRWCAQAQLLWESSDAGEKQPSELPEIARDGGKLKERT